MSDATWRERAGDRPGLAPTERGWGKLLLALAAFLLVPSIPHLGAFAPVQQTLLLFVPAMAACSLVGWWAGGRFLPAAAWVALAIVVTSQAAAGPGTFGLLARGWTLLLAGSFGLVCLLGVERPFFSRALVALTMVLVVVVAMGAVGPVSAAQAKAAVASELARRNTAVLAKLQQAIAQSPDWKRLAAQAPALEAMPEGLSQQLTTISASGAGLFLALLAIESLCALALAWATYHRFSRARLGAPLAPLRHFRFNDQLVGGLIVGLTILFVPSLQGARPVGRNLVLFFGALYMLRGLGVLTWFTSARALGAAAAVGVLLLLLGVLTLMPSLVALVVLAISLVSVLAMGLGLGDTWADWRSRARPTT